MPANKSERNVLNSPKVWQADPNPHPRNCSANYPVFTIHEDDRESFGLIILEEFAKCGLHTIAVDYTVAQAGDKVTYTAIEPLSVSAVLRLISAIEGRRIVNEAWVGPISLQYDQPPRPGILTQYRCLTLSCQPLPPTLDRQIRALLAQAGVGDEERDFVVTRGGSKVVFHLLRALPAPTVREFINQIEELVEQHNHM